MKTALATCLCFFLLLSNAFAQTRDLISLAEGDFLGMNALFKENGDLFGYIAVYNYGKSGDKTKKFEYVMLDKNLNPFANKTFDGDITAGDYSGYINFDGKIVLRPTMLDLRYVNKDNAYTPSAMVINLNDNTIKRKVFYDYDHGKFIEKVQHDSWEQSHKENKEEKKENGFNYVATVNEIKEGGYLVSDCEDHGAYETHNRIMRYDEDKKLLWSYEYNKTGSKKQSDLLYFISKDENYYYGILIETNKHTDNRFFLLVIDMKTGKELKKKQIEGSPLSLLKVLKFNTLSYGQLRNRKSFDDKIVLVGRTGPGYDSYTGISRLVIDKKTLDVSFKMLLYEDDFKPYIPKINALGHVEKGYFLEPRDIFFMKDGSIGMLFEKYKLPGEFSAQKTTDLVYIYTDKDFKMSGAKILEKEKSKWQNSDYLFSQTLNDGKDIVFFYRDFEKNDETKDRNWNLYINTLINGNFKQEMIPISSKGDFVIFPYIAKEGYILLQEFNKKAKYNQVRLERLNY